MIIFMVIVFVIAIGTLFLAARRTLSPAPVIVSTTTEGTAPLATSTATETPRVPNSAPATSFTIQ